MFAVCKAARHLELPISSNANAKFWSLTSNNWLMRLKASQMGRRVPKEAVVVTICWTVAFVQLFKFQWLSKCRWTETKKAVELW